MRVPLACPRCRSPLAGNDDQLTCSQCDSRFPLVAGVPVLLPERLSAQHVSQQHYFDAEFARYDRYTVENWRLSFIKRIFGGLDVAHRSPYLDVAVGGSGATVIEAARVGVEAVGVDLSLEGILTVRRFAEEQGVQSGVQLVVCAAEELPFPAATFESVSAVAVLEHLDDDRRAAAELARVTVPGGLVWVTVPHAFRYMPPPIWPAYWWHDRRIGHKRHYDERRLIDVFASVGMEHVQTQFSAHPVKVLQFVLHRLLPGVRRAESRWWWRLEDLDARARGRAWGALQLSAVFRASAA